MRKLVALLLTGTMLASMSMSAFAFSETAATDQTVEGDNGVKNPIINYQIPLRLDFAIDAFQKADSSGSQIFSSDFAIINKSDVALKAAVSSKIVETVADSLLVKDAAHKVTTNDAGNSDKEIYMETVAAKSIKTTETTAAVAHGAGVEPATITTQATTPTITFTDGNGTDAATFTVDLTGLVAADPNTSGGADYSVTILAGASGSETFWGEVTSDAVTGATAATPTADEIAAKFVGKTIQVKSKGEIYTFTGAAAGTPDSTVIFTADKKNQIYDTAPASFKFEVGPGKGTAAVVAVDMTDGNAPEYPTYDKKDASDNLLGSNTEAKTIFADDGTDIKAPALNFVLQKGQYVKDYDTIDEATLFSQMAADIAADPTNNIVARSNPGVAAFRFRGTVNPSAQWQKEDFKVKTTFAISPVGNDAYQAAEWLDTDHAQNVMAAPREPSAPTLNDGTLTATIASLTDAGVIKIPYDLGFADLAATGVAKVEYARGTATTYTEAVVGTNYTDDTTNSKLVFTSGFNNLMSNGGKVKVTFNDADATSIIIELTV